MWVGFTYVCKQHDEEFVLFYNPFVTDVKLFILFVILSLLFVIFR